MSHWNKMLLGLLEITSGLIRVFTLGYYAPRITHSFVTWDTVRRWSLMLDIPIENTEGWYDATSDAL